MLQKPKSFLNTNTHTKERENGGGGGCDCVGIISSWFWTFAEVSPYLSQASYLRITKTEFAAQQTITAPHVTQLWNFWCNIIGMLRPKDYNIYKKLVRLVLIQIMTQPNIVQFKLCSHTHILITRLKHCWFKERHFNRNEANADPRYSKITCIKIFHY